MHTIDKTFRVNLAQGKNITAHNYRMNHKKFSPSHVLDDNNRTYWAADDTLSESNNIPAVSSFGIYKASKLDRKIYSVYINKVIQE